ncbi:peptidase S8/S53 subtilisin kexin sedolisin [Verrucomicrobiota bacterium sgz303538]
MSQYQLQADPPVSISGAQRATAWLKTHYGVQLVNAVQGTPFTVDNLCGIACQETAYFWLPFIDRLSPEEVCARCVLDGTGDVSGTEGDRNVFPRNAAEFRSRYGDSFTQMLIDEANKTRALHAGWSPKQWLYKGYGIFQYDLQFVAEDKEFFLSKLWYSFDECLKRVMQELTRTWNQHGNVFEAIQAYNGSGARARVYAQNVMVYSDTAVQVAALAQPVNNTASVSTDPAAEALSQV